MSSTPPATERGTRPIRACQEGSQDGGVVPVQDLNDHDEGMGMGQEVRVGDDDEGKDVKGMFRAMMNEMKEVRNDVGEVRDGLGMVRKTAELAVSLAEQ